MPKIEKEKLEDITTTIIIIICKIIWRMNSNAKSFKKM